MTAVSAGTSLGNIERAPILFSMESAKRTEQEVEASKTEPESEIDSADNPERNRSNLQPGSTLPNSDLGGSSTIPNAATQSSATNPAQGESGTSTTGTSLPELEGTVPTTLPLLEPLPEVTVPTVTVPTVETPVNPEDSEFLDETNQVRAEDLLWSDELAQYADIHLQAMMAAGVLFHSNISSLLVNWSVVGENVGVGPSVISIQEAMLASPTHRENVIFQAYTHFGSSSRTGLFRGAEAIYTVHIFATR